ncbi:hypothetical protein ACFFL1_05840 [Samsonia erythrinae]
MEQNRYTCGRAPTVKIGQNIIQSVYCQLTVRLRQEAKYCLNTLAHRR